MTPYFNFNDTYTQAPFNRSAANGIRLVKYLGEEPNLAQAGEPLQRVFRDFLKERPVSRRGLRRLPADVPVRPDTAQREGAGDGR